MSAAELDELSPAEWAARWVELSDVCPSRIAPKPLRWDPLRLVVLPSSEIRCSEKSPDGRGLRWLLSGGDPIAYGRCARSDCPRAKETR